jgi:hypothetical protein
MLVKLELYYHFRKTFGCCKEIQKFWQSNVSGSKMVQVMLRCNTGFHVKYIRTIRAATTSPSKYELASSAFR